MLLSEVAAELFVRNAATLAGLSTLSGLGGRLHCFLPWLSFFLAGRLGFVLVRHFCVFGMLRRLGLFRPCRFAFLLRRTSRFRPWLGRFGIIVLILRPHQRRTSEEQRQSCGAGESSEFHNCYLLSDIGLGTSRSLLRLR